MHIVFENYQRIGSVAIGFSILLLPKKKMQTFQCEVKTNEKINANAIEIFTCHHKMFDIFAFTARS